MEVSPANRDVRPSAFAKLYYFMRPDRGRMVCSLCLLYTSYPSIRSTSCCRWPTPTCACAPAASLSGGAPTRSHGSGWRTRRHTACGIRTWPRPVSYTHLPPLRPDALVSKLDQDNMIER